jgi:hypothetical protein
MSESDESDRDEDVVLLHSPTESGDGIHVVRKRKDTIEVGELRPMKEGQPIHGEVVRLTQRSENENLFDCEVMVPSPTRKAPELPAAPAASAAPKTPAPEEPTGVQHKGPPRVATDAYRGGWDAIFGKRENKNNAPN